MSVPKDPSSYKEANCFLPHYKASAQCNNIILIPHEERLSVCPHRDFSSL